MLPVFGDLDLPHALSEPTTKISMKIDQYYEQQRCSTKTEVSGNIRYMRHGVPWRRGVKRQWGDRKRRFSGLSNTLRYLRKWGQHYSCVVLFSPLPPFHWPQNRWPWNDLEWPFWFCYFFVLRTATSEHTLTAEPIYKIYFVVSRDQPRRAEANPGA